MNGLLTDLFGVEKCDGLGDCCSLGNDAAKIEAKLSGRDSDWVLVVIGEDDVWSTLGAFINKQNKESYFAKWPSFLE